VTVLQASVDTSSVELRDSSTSGGANQWSQMTSTDWGYWIYSTTGFALVPPLYFRLTPVTGKVVTVTALALVPSGVFESGQQY
jgi:hypothetical protein